jgi:tetratricopeptide (TPR) repeat protein
MNVFRRKLIALLLGFILCARAASGPARETKSEKTPPTTSAQVAKWMRSIPELLKAEKLDEAEAQLKEWDKVAPAHPDLYIWRANWLGRRAAAQDQLRMDALPSDHKGPIPGATGNSYALTDPKTGELAGAVYQLKGPDHDRLTSEALDQLLQAQEMYPLRMDIHLGVAHLYSQSGDYAKVHEVMRRATDIAIKQDHKGLLWMGNEPMKDPQEQLAVALHSHYRAYSRGEDPDDKLAFDMAKHLTEAYPKDVRGWNDLSAEYAQREQPAKVLECLLKAHALDPKDPLVARNAAYFLEHENRRAEALKFYKLVISLHPDDEELIEEAKEKVKLLGKPKDDEGTSVTGEKRKSAK